MQKDQRKPESASPNIVEMLAAAMLGLAGSFVVVAAVRSGGDFSGRWWIPLIASGFLGLSIWIGGAALLRPRTWTATGKMAGAFMIIDGMVTVITGHHTVGPAKIWTNVDRAAGLDFVIPGLALFALSFLVDAFLKRKRA